MKRTGLILTILLLTLPKLWTQNTSKPRTDGKICFGVISDVHVGITPVLGAGNNLCLQHAFDYFSNPKLRAEQVIVVGDFADYGTRDELDVFCRIREKHLQIPLLASMGNHDANNWEVFEQATGCKANDVKAINGYYFITVSPGAGALDETTMRATGYNADRYDYIRPWLAGQVAQAKAASGGKPVFVFVHHPLTGDTGLENLFDGDPQVICFSGHIHLPNNSPLGIRQDKGFTEVNTAVTGLVAQGLLVEADRKGNIQITTQDFNRRQKIQQWTFNINKPLPYTDAIRTPLAKAPVFSSKAEVKVTDVAVNTAVIAFGKAAIPLPNPANDIVFSYRGELIKKASGERVRNFNASPSLFSDTVKHTLRGLDKNTAYEVRIYASDAWKKESPGYISGTFHTAEKERTPVKPIDYVLCFEGDLSNGDNPPAHMYRQAVNPGLYDTAPRFEAGVHGRAIALSSLNFVELDGDGEWIDYRQSFSTAFWIQVKSVRNDGEPAILSNRNVNREYYNGFSFRTCMNEGANWIVLEYSPVNGAFARLPVAPTRIGQWMHLAATFDYLRNRIKVYVNGLVVQDVEADLSGGIGGIVDECPFKSTFLGSSPWNYSQERGGYNGCGKGTNDITFLVDDFVMSSRVFAQEEVAALLISATTVVYPSSVRLNKGDRLRFTAETPVTENDRQAIWRMEGATSAQTKLEADGTLTVGADETAAELTVWAISAKGTKGASSVTVTTPRSDGKINFGVITDVHVGGSANLNAGNNLRLAKAFEFFNDPALQAERVALTGDLSGNGNWLELLIFRLIRQQYLQIPLLATMGNHEENKWENFERATGNKPNEANVINGYYFISVSPGDGKLNETTMRATGESQSKYAYIKEWLLARIAEAEAASEAKPVFVFQHHAVVDSGHDLYRALRNHPRVVIFSGDTHDVNNHPLSIRQDGGFTWIHAGATCSEAEFDYTSEGIYAEADDKGNVTVKTRDFTNNRWIEDQVWSFNVNRPALYTDALRRPKAPAPVFGAGAKIKATNIQAKSVTVTFDRPKIPANSIHDIVYTYRYRLGRKNRIVKDETEWADICLYPVTKTKSIELKGLEKATAYKLEIYATDVWGKQSKPLAVTFTTAAADTVRRKPIDYRLPFDGSLKNDGARPSAVNMFYLEAKPNVYDTVPHFETGIRGQAIDLGKHNFIALDANADLIDYDQSFSVACWINVKMVRQDGRPGLLSNRNVDGDPYKGYAFHTGDNNGVNWFYVDISPVNGDGRRLWIAPVNLGEWIHLATTFDYDRNKAICYVNGTKATEADVDLSGGIGGITGAGRNKATFLGSTPWNYTEEHGGFNGSGTGGRNDIRFLADDFIMTSRVLTAEEVAALCR
ncbi:MAG: metallophosphoesterase [Tannerellaceae bacterium]|nr:metallophosphoesterase [Tannerellaceae bacterium]